MSTRKYTTIISEDECIGDSLDTINSNFANLDTTSSSISAQFNTLIQTLTGFAPTGTDYTSLSTQFINLSSLITS
jgi:hypothetical protein